MTKYVLHGGFTHVVNSTNSDFYRELLADGPKHTKILLVYFAREDDQVETQYLKDKLCFERENSDKQLTFEIANVATFPNQINQADVIFISGGSTLKALHILSGFLNLNQLFTNKTVAGESAGAYVLSTYFYSKTTNGLFLGLGLVPVKTICHYNGENQEKLDSTPAGLEKLLLPNHCFKIFNL